MANIESEYSNFFASRPIALLQKSYSHMVRNVNRNMGNMEHGFDGYWTPVGQLIDPNEGSNNNKAAFLRDPFKNASSDYINYIRNIYGDTLSIENINNKAYLNFNNYETKVGVIESSDIYNPLINGSENTQIFTNPNGNGTDTTLGEVSGYNLINSLRKSINSSYDKEPLKFGITDAVRYVYGMNESAVSNYDVLNIGHRRSPVTGRFEDLNPIGYGYFSPFDANNFGNYSSLGVYTDYFNLSSPIQRVYYSGMMGLNRYQPSASIYGEWSNNYIDSLGISVGYDTIGFRPYTIDSTILDTSIVETASARYTFRTLAEHSNMFNSFVGGLNTYAEDEYGSSPDISLTSFNGGTAYGRYASYGAGLTANDILKKTNDSFKKGKYKTIVARFHTDNDPDAPYNTTQTAVSKVYGMSHGRNLLKLQPDTSQGYDNPYCRVWTYHHQYHRLADAIRPFQENGKVVDDNTLYNVYGFNNFTRNDDASGFGDGRSRLGKYGVKNPYNGLVNITPSSVKADKKVDIRNCMFSIENLAWKDIFSTDRKSREAFQAKGLSPEQKGPFGGRIMWFPPYDLKFNENISATWNETNFIGRGEPIFTYANTSRDGNLSFKMLIDHPAILNYWEEKGRSVSNSVDDKDDPEQKILRFFAGCEMLTGKPKIEEKEAKDHVYDDPEPNPSTMKISFFVFYPNDYSGKDDDPEKAITYLLNGVGTGKAVLSGTTYLSGDTRIHDFVPIQEMEFNGKPIGGYEVRPGTGISLVNTQTDGDAFVGSVKMSGEENQVVDMYVQSGQTSDVWYKRKWYYRVDKSFQHEILRKESYIDRTSYGLNSKYGEDTIRKAYGIDENEELYSLADIYVALAKNPSIRDIIYDFCDESKVLNLIDKISNYDVESVKCIGLASVQGNSASEDVNISRNNDLQIRRASTIRNWLAEHSVIGDMCDFDKMEAITGGTGGENVKLDDVNDVHNKVYRAAKVEIYLKASESKTIQNAESERIYSGDSGTVETVLVGDMRPHTTVRVPYFNDLMANRTVEHRVNGYPVKNTKLNRVIDNVASFAMNLRNIRGGNPNVVNSVFGAVEDFVDNSVYNEMINGSDDPKYGLYDGGSVGKNIPSDSSSDGSVIMHNKAVNAASMGETSSLGLSDRISNDNVTRYDNESRFFELLETEAPFMHHKISDKIKYFDPAFHSVSPEGFNARLTFLQQCMRQGPTVALDDENTANNTANNLSFGRPPVCILRIGDFYYTKIIIRSISIDYDPMVWDLNQEGIGVMPMMANVNISFNFIGGSSLAGPISRLQNALSFNMYANTEVYDDRADLAEYDDNGNITKMSVFLPPR